MTTERRRFALRGLIICLAMVFLNSIRAFGQSEVLVYTFPQVVKQFSAAGCNPRGNLVSDSAGNLYGTAEGCGLGGGVVFELLRPVPPSKAWTETVLYAFFGGADGLYPMAGVVLDAKGDLFGTTSAGGAANLGTVFELSPPAVAGGQWTKTLLHSFKGGLTDGAYPVSNGVVLDSAGNVYGVTTQGGIGLQEYGFSSTGVAYELTPPATQGAAWTETLIHSFTVKNGAFTPIGAPIFDGKGNMYGATQGGGANNHNIGAGVYRLTHPSTPGGSWIYRLLYSFGSPVDAPQASLVFHNNGRLYGTTQYGGQAGEGSVFELIPPVVAGDPWTQNVIHSFYLIPSDALQPVSGVVFDNKGNLYGTTPYGGDNGKCNSNQVIPGCGTVFKLAPPTEAGGDWTETILHSFDATSADGEIPLGGLLYWKNGVLYGSTSGGGRFHQGTVYGIVP
jgi:uncharacterized repeat protein (TIGR03803 family)